MLSALQRITDVAVGESQQTGEAKVDLPHVEWLLPSPLRIRRRHCVDLGAVNMNMFW